MCFAAVGAGEQEDLVDADDKPGFFSFKATVEHRVESASRLGHYSMSVYMGYFNVRDLRVSLTDKLG